jgi:hypothetical protein
MSDRIAECSEGEELSWRIISGKITWAGNKERGQHPSTVVHAAYHHVPRDR